MQMPVIRVPRERVGVLIGPDGATRREIQERSGILLVVDSESGEVRIDAAKAFEPVLALKARDVVSAIGRGFAPDKAFRLWQDDVYLEVMDLTEFVGRKAANLERVKARIIGTHGKTRITIESLVGAQLSIYGKTVSILGEADELTLAREAVEMLVRGAPHPAVYRFLEQKRRELRLKDLGLA